MILALVIICQVNFSAKLCLNPNLKKPNVAFVVLLFVATYWRSIRKVIDSAEVALITSLYYPINFWNMNRINQVTVLFSCQLILGGYIATPTQAEVISSPVAIAQTVVETLPPPHLNKSRSHVDEVFVPRDLDFRVPPPITQKSGNYLVYINNANSIQLEQVKQIIPTAFRRQLQGKSVIQAGVFSKELNATSLAQKLQSQGISPRIFNLSTAKEVALIADKSKV